MNMRPKQKEFVELSSQGDLLSKGNTNFDGHVTKGQISQDRDFKMGAKKTHDLVEIESFVVSVQSIAIELSEHNGLLIF